MIDRWTVSHLAQGSGYGWTDGQSLAWLRGMALDGNMDSSSMVQNRGQNRASVLLATCAGPALDCLCGQAVPFIRLHWCPGAVLWCSHLRPGRAPSPAFPTARAMLRSPGLWSMRSPSSCPGTMGFGPELTCWWLEMGLAAAPSCAGQTPLVCSPDPDYVLV